MNTHKVMDARHDLCKLLADLDGCEGGEFLMQLFDLYRDAWGGGYAYSGDGAEHTLKGLLDEEIAAHKEMIFGPNPEDFGYDDYEQAQELVLAAEVKIADAINEPI